MRQSVPTLLCVLFLLSQVQCLVIIDSILATDCIYYMKDFDWGCNSTKQSATAYKCRCFNIDWIGSVTSCFESEGGDNTGLIDHAYRHLRQRCLTKGNIDWPVDVLKSYQQNATAYLEYPTEEDTERQVYHPLLVNETGFQYYKDSFNHIYAQVIRSQSYQWGYVFFWGAVIIVASVANCASYFSKYSSSSKSNSMFKSLRAKFIVSNIKNKLIRKLLHLRTFESIILFFFISYGVLASSTGYTIELPNAYMNGYIWQLLDLIGYRTALGAFGLIPPVFFFGIRNNPFIWITGLPLSTFLKFHKWSAMMMSTLALVHSSVWTDYTIREGDYYMWSMDAYWKWGIVGTTVLFLMMGFSIRILRHVAYELFLFIHQLFGILFIVAMWYHCNVMGWMWWLYMSILIWGYDRLMRFCSVLWNGGVKTCKIDKLDDDLIRILVPGQGGYLPGCYKFYYFMNLKLRMFQSHPFSMMKSMRSGEENMDCIVVKVHRGITGKIMEQLNNSEKESMLCDVMCEGPYGSPVLLDSHSQYVFISAGIGFTPCYSLAVDLIQRNRKLGFEKGMNKLVTFIWVVKSTEYFELFEEDMQYLVDNGVQLKVIVTRENSNGTSYHNRAFPKDSFHLLGQRPHVSELVKKSTEIDGSTCFVSSGPQLFVEEVRDAVTELIPATEHRIDLYDESFVL